jgi:hypothetical protein
VARGGVKIAKQSRQRKRGVLAAVVPNFFTLLPWHFWQVIAPFSQRRQGQ